MKGFKEMEKAEWVYQKAIENSKCAFARHEAIFDGKGKMVDYAFLDINPSFEEITGLKKEEVVGKWFVRDIAQDTKDARSWVKKYSEVVGGSRQIEFEEYSREFRKDFTIKVYPVGEKEFVTLFLDVTFEKKFHEIAKYFRDNMGNRMDYNEVTKYVCQLSGAEYTAFNLYDDDGTFTTVALCGINKKIQAILEKAGIIVEGRKWEPDPVREEKIKDKEIAFFPNLRELVGSVLPQEVVFLLEKTMGLGSVAVAKIKKDETTFGDFTLFFKEKATFKNEKLFLLYLSQLGLFIEKSRLEQSLKRSQNQFYTLAEYAPIGFVSCNTKGEITYANKKLLEILGSPSLEETKKINLLTFPKLKVAGFSSKLKESMNRNRLLVHEIEYTSLWGKHSWLRVYFTPTQENNRVVGINVVVDDITKTKEDEEKLVEKAQRDFLTRAYNRYALETLLSDYLLEAKEKTMVSCIAVVDIDAFKKINDTYGHRAGDTVLKSLAARIKQELRGKDLLIRTGGDEFLVYFHDIQSGENALNRIEQLFHKISSRYRFDDLLKDKHVELDVRCSIGAVMFPRDGETVEVLMAKADELLYEIKAAGKGAYQLAL